MYVRILILIELYIKFLLKYLKLYIYLKKSIIYIVFIFILYNSKFFIKSNKLPLKLGNIMCETSYKSLFLTKFLILSIAHIENYHRNDYD